MELRKIGSVYPNFPTYYVSTLSNLWKLECASWIKEFRNQFEINQNMVYYFEMNKEARIIKIETLLKKG
jgi:hypothetical protein